MKYVSYINSSVSCLQKLKKNNFLIISTNTKVVVKGEDESVEERKYGVVNERKT
jgi:hypothetical protein